MEPTEVDARTVAATLRIDTYDLAGLLAGWAAAELAGLSSTLDIERPDVATLEDFDDRVEKAREHYESALAAYETWRIDNDIPEDDDEVRA